MSQGIVDQHGRPMSQQQQSTPTRGGSMKHNRSVPGSGLYLINEQGDRIDPLDPSENPNAGGQTLIHLAICAFRRPFRTGLWMVVGIMLLGFTVNALKAGVLVATGAAQPVAPGQLTDPNSTQMGHVAGSAGAVAWRQMIAPALVSWASEGQLTPADLAVQQQPGATQVSGATTVSYQQPGQAQQYNGQLILNRR